ncbi:hypothetical protein [Streptomyces sp. NBC_01428]|uniref:hypothetical protein n=1 Tax=Streptomyces sp. NBC_01428 TaxID=2903861 RepID=UPI002E305CD0|nr:hypothetical protein [Streptomyces sp. NBC_01428]
MSRGQCGFTECEKPRNSYGLCDGHYQQKYRRREELRPLKKKSRQHYWENGRKVCPGCGKSKDAIEYSGDKYQPSGKKQYCKDCQRLSKAKKN